MTIESTIKHCNEVAERKLQYAAEAEMDGYNNFAKTCKKCAEEHKQLAEWLKELKQLREQKESIINDNDRYCIVEQGCPNCGYGTIFIDKK